MVRSLSLGFSQAREGQSAGRLIRAGHPVMMPTDMSSILRNPAEDFRVGVVAPPTALDPRIAKDTATHTLLRQIFEPPFVIRAGKVVPLLFDGPLSEERGSQPQRPVYSARITAGVVFSDGAPLTAELAARSLAATKPVIDKADVTHEGDRVIFKLREPDPRFDLLLTSTYCCIVMQKGEELLGTGAFVYERPLSQRTLATATRVRLVRNARFRRATRDAGHHLRGLSTRRRRYADAAARGMREG
jgi:ABC-type transport system substrate-binding protein